MSVKCRAVWKHEQDTTMNDVLEAPITSQQVIAVSTYQRCGVSAVYRVTSPEMGNPVT